MLALACLFAAGCRRGEEAPPPLAKEVAPFLRWCEEQGPARSACLVAAARVTGDAAACARIKAAAADRTACLLAAARTAGRIDACRALADRELVRCAFTLAAEQERGSVCDVLGDVHWQGGGAESLCRGVARGDPGACGPEVTPGLGPLCLEALAVRLRDPGPCGRLGKDAPELPRCIGAVAVARRLPAECAVLGAGARRRCEVEVEIARGRFPPCFGDPSACDRSLWTDRPCEGSSGDWADDCRIHQAVFGTGPYGCGVVQDSKRRALCGELRDAEEGLTRKGRAADAGSRPAGGG